ncbi:MAG: hypothetical protein ABI687_01515 [Flavitalea sp.]
MKKLVAITLLLIHFFNLAGYLFLFWYLSIESNKQAVSIIDKHQYKTEDLIEVKVPVNMPYVSNWNDYEPFEGEIILNGIHRNYVKRKVSDDTLYLLCLPNKQRDKLLVAKNDFSNKVNDVNDPDKKTDGQVKKINLINTYYSPLAEYCLNTPEIIQTRISISLIPSLHHSFIDEDGRPPKMNS